MLKRINILKHYVLAVLMLAVLGVHIYHRTKGLTPWKGGAFGMYTTYQPGKSPIFVDGKVYVFRENLFGDFYLNRYLFYPRDVYKTQLTEYFFEECNAKTINIYEFKTQDSVIYKKIKHHVELQKP